MRPLAAALAALAVAASLLAAATAGGVTGSDTITTVAGNGLAPPPTGDGGLATFARFGAPHDMAIAPDGSILVADFVDSRIRRIAPNGQIETIAGTGGLGGFSGDGGPATAAQLNLPFGIAIDAQGNVYVADQNNQRIRRIAPNGTISTIAGNGNAAFSGDGGPAANAELSFPQGIDVDAAGNVYVADQANNRIRRIATNGIITTVAGNGAFAFGGDGGPATQASLQLPTDVAVAADGALLIADQLNERVRRVAPNGIITTLAGLGTQGFSGDGGPATLAQLNRPIGVAVDRAGNVYVTDSQNRRVRRIAPNGIITTVAGNGLVGFAGDGGPAALARLGAVGLEVEPDGSLLIADAANRRIRRVVNLQPTAAFTAVPEAGAAPLRVAFDASASADPNGDIVSFQWTFGDGTSGQGVTTEHVYAQPGTYTATLTVMDDSGARHATSRTITVGPPPPPPPPAASPPTLTLSAAAFQPRWRLSRLSGFLRIGGRADRAARLRLEVLAPSGRRLRPVQRATFSVGAGAFTRRVPLRLRPAPARLPLRYTIRLSEILPRGAPGPALPTRTRVAVLRPPPFGVVRRAFIARQIGARPAATIARGTGILFAHFDFAARPRRGLRLSAVWRPPGSRSLVNPVRAATSTRAVSFIRSRAGALPPGVYRVQLRAGRITIATARVRIR